MIYCTLRVTTNHAKVKNCDSSRARIIQVRTASCSRILPERFHLIALYDRYYQPAQESGTADAQSPTVPQSSSDPCLTAFAQLGALRLNAKRGLITLSSISAEYILAEAGQSLSLQKDDDHKDRLWHGVGVLKDNSGLGPDLVKLFCTPEADVPFVVINDLTKHETFKHKSVVAGPPYVRSLACVPLISPLHSMVIGTYIVVDDKPRDGLNEDEITYLIDMATTVMDYLESGRIKKKEFRAERMVKAIGLFIEGKETLRDWWLEAGFKSHRSTVTKRARDDVGELKEVADAVFGVQDPPAEEISVNGMSGLPDRSDFCPATPSTETPSHLDLGDGRPAASRGDSLFSSSDTTVPSTILSQPRERAISMTTYEVDGVTPTSETKGHSVAFELPPESERPEISKELQEAVLSNEVKRVFSRAGNLIREAVGVSGVVYFDASVGSFGGGSETDALEEKAPQGSLIDAAILNGEDDVGLRSSDTDASMYGTPPESPVRPPEKTCNILGYSTRKRSSLRGHSPSSELCGFPEAVLRKLLKRYPHGMVFYFDEDGSYLSADSDEISGTKEKRRSLSPHRSNSLDSRSRRKRISREAEAAAILKALPGARSVFWFPLWDQSRERWFAGSLVWSTSPTRVLSTFEDLAYMAAFGNSTMTEVTRLFAQRISHMKSDFISSISHELRSPLHGILASVEFLQETPMSEIQTDMVGNIQASGKVLLDTIDHVLDFSKVNMKPKDLKQRTKRPGKRPRKPREEAKGLDGAEIEEVADVCVLSEEVIESIYIGHQITKLASSGGVVLGNQPPSASDEPPVTVIVDIAWSPNWTFEVDPGAWRRVLMNIFNNAMKYTNSGYVKVSLKITDDPQYRGKGTRPILSLSVQDSGKGMSKEFLNHHVYKPFAQEDELAEGAGLGLSIVRRIVHDLKGKIKISSEQGSGTDVTIRIPLMCATPLSKDVHGDLISEVKKETTGLKFCLQGFDRYPSIAETPTGILSADLEAAMLLKSSLKTLLTDWFGMESVTPLALGDSNVDVVILMESGITSLEDTLKSYSDARPATSKNLIAIVLCSAHHSDSTTVSYGSTRAFYLQQP